MPGWYESKRRIERLGKNHVGTITCPHCSEQIYLGMGDSSSFGRTPEEWKRVEYTTCTYADRREVFGLETYSRQPCPHCGGTICHTSQ